MELSTNALYVMKNLLIQYCTCVDICACVMSVPCNNGEVEVADNVPSVERLFEMSFDHTDRDDMMWMIYSLPVHLLNYKEVFSVKRHLLS